MHGKAIVRILTKLLTISLFFVLLFLGGEGGSNNYRGSRKGKFQDLLSLHLCTVSIFYHEHILIYY